VQHLQKQYKNNLQTKNTNIESIIHGNVWREKKQSNIRLQALKLATRSRQPPLG